MDNFLERDLIVVIAYNRPKSLNRILTFLKDCYYHKTVDLIISIDFNENQEEVIQIAEEFNWEFGNKTIRRYRERQGLRKHVLQCGDLSENYRSIIMFEDDIVPSKYFYLYVDEAIKFYKNDDRISGISLYSPTTNEMVEKPFAPISTSYDTFFIQSASSWGQCWTKKMWFNFKNWYNTNSGPLIKSDDMPSKIYSWPESSWKKYFMKYLVVTDKYFVYPYTSLSTNFTDVGQHAKNTTTLYQVPIQMEKKIYCFANFTKGVKYDSFFENISLNGFDGNNICIDLYGSKTSYLGFDRLLSTKILDYKILNSYGLSFKPHEVNYLFENEGNDIFLYNLNVKNNNKKKFSGSKAKYYSNSKWTDSLIVGLLGLKNYLTKKLKNNWRNK